MALSRVGAGIAASFLTTAAYWAAAGSAPIPLPIRRTPPITVRRCHELCIAFSQGFAGRLTTATSTANDRVIDEKHDHGTDDRDKDAVQIEAGHARSSNKAKEPAADNGTDDSE